MQKEYRRKPPNLRHFLAFMARGDSRVACETRISVGFSFAASICLASIAILGTGPSRLTSSGMLGIASTTHLDSCKFSPLIA